MTDTEKLKIAIEALEDIEQHMDIIAGDSKKLSTVWLIATSALTKLEGNE